MPGVEDDVSARPTPRSVVQDPGRAHAAHDGAVLLEGPALVSAPVARVRDDSRKNNDI